MTPICDKCQNNMILEGTDNRVEWAETLFICPNCDRGATHRTEYDQSGLVTKDNVVYYDIED